MTTNPISIPGFRPIYDNSVFQSINDPTSNSSQIEIIEIHRRDLPKPNQILHAATETARHLQDKTLYNPAYEPIAQALRGCTDTELRQWTDPDALFTPYVNLVYTSSKIAPLLSADQHIFPVPSLDIVISHLDQSSWDQHYSHAANQQELSDNLTSSTGASQQRPEQYRLAISSNHRPITEDAVHEYRDLLPFPTSSTTPVYNLLRGTRTDLDRLVSAEETDRLNKSLLDIARSSLIPTDSYKQLDDMSAAYLATQAADLVNYTQQMIHTDSPLGRSVEWSFFGDSSLK